MLPGIANRSLGVGRICFFIWRKIDAVKSIWKNMRVCDAFAMLAVLVFTAEACVERSTIMARAQRWVKNKVPYSQTRSYEGHRTDCSGFVSMAWGLPKPGLTTYTMHTVARNITKSELLPGDAINAESRHIVLFGGWTNSSKTHFYSLEEANTRKGTIKRVVPYPYFAPSQGYHPIRYKNVC